MDRTQLTMFCEYAIGSRVVGGEKAGDEVTTPHAPELLAFVQGRLGDLTPGSGWQIIGWPGRRPNDDWVQKGRAFAALLREVADGIDDCEEPTP